MSMDPGAEGADAAVADASTGNGGFPSGDGSSDGLSSMRSITSDIPSEHTGCGLAGFNRSSPGTRVLRRHFRFRTQVPTEEQTGSGLAEFNSSWTNLTQVPVLPGNLPEAPIEKPEILGVNIMTVIGLIILSALYLSRAPPLLRATVHPLDFFWTLALMMCSYMFFWVWVLSQTMSPLKIFFRISYGILLAISADSMVTPMSGYVIMHLTTCWTAGLLGYALGEHRQCIGSELTASRMAPPPPPLTKNDEILRKGGDINVVCMMTVFSLGLATRIVMLANPQPDYPFFIIVGELSLLTGIIIYLWILVISKMLLFEALISVTTLANGVFCLMAFTGFSGTCFLVSTTLWALYFWIGMLSAGAVFGYMISIRARYNQNQVLESSRRLLADKTCAAIPAAAATT